MSNARQYETEAEFASAIRELAQLRGWLDFHVLRSKGTRHGLPDLVLLRVEPYPRLIFAEVKGPGGKLTEEQLYVLEALRRVAAMGVDDDDDDEPDVVGGLNPELRLSFRINPSFEVYCWWPEDWELLQKVLE